MTEDRYNEIKDIVDKGLIEVDGFYVSLMFDEINRLREAVKREQGIAAEWREMCYNLTASGRKFLEANSPKP